MDLFRDPQIRNNPRLRKLAKHELKELGGKKTAEAHERKVEMATKMGKKPSVVESKTYTHTRCGKCNRFGHHHSECKSK